MFYEHVITLEFEKYGFFDLELVQIQNASLLRKDVTEGHRKCHFSCASNRDMLMTLIKKHKFTLKFEPCFRYFNHKN